MGSWRHTATEHCAGCLQLAINAVRCKDVLVDQGKFDQLCSLLIDVRRTLRKRLLKAPYGTFDSTAPRKLRSTPSPSQSDVFNSFLRSVPVSNFTKINARVSSKSGTTRKQRTFCSRWSNVWRASTENATTTAERDTLTVLYWHDARLPAVIHYRKELSKSVGFMTRHESQHQDQLQTPLCGCQLSLEK